MNNKNQTTVVKMEKYQLKPRFSSYMYEQMSLACSHFVIEFNQRIKPLAILFGFGDDESIKKFLGSVSTREIYEAAVSKDRQRIDLMRDLYKARGEDLWSGFRAEGCLVESPEKDGFEFREMPCVQTIFREKWLKAISVKNGLLQVDEKILKQESLVYPSPRRQECYAGFAAFCDWLKEKNFKIKNKKSLFVYDKNGDLEPNEKLIMFVNTGLD